MPFPHGNVKQLAAAADTLLRITNKEDELPTTAAATACLEGKTETKDEEEDVTFAKTSV